MEENILKHIQIIEAEIKAIHKVVDEGYLRLLVRGLLHGGGFILGTVLTIALLGWVLNFFGFIPGLADVASTLKEILNSR